MPPLQTYKPGQRIAPPSVCIYGRTGTGKTTLMGTMPSNGFVIDIPQVEGGNFVLEDKAATIDVIDVRDWDAIDDIFWALMKKDKTALPNVDFDKLRWIGIDSVTAMQNLAKRKVVKERDLDADPHQITQQEWGKIGSLVSELVFRFRTLPYMTVFVAQERKFGGGDNDEPTMFGPDVSPSALQALLPPMTVVGRLSVDPEGNRTLRVGPHSMYYTKCRATPGKNVPPVIARPNLSGLLRYLTVGGKPPRAARSSVFLE